HGHVAAGGGRVADVQLAEVGLVGDGDVAADRGRAAGEDVDLVGAALAVDDQGAGGALDVDRVDAEAGVEGRRRAGDGIQDREGVPAAAAVDGDGTALEQIGVDLRQAQDGDGIAMCSLGYRHIAWHRIGRVVHVQGDEAAGTVNGAGV